MIMGIRVNQDWQFAPSAENVSDLPTAAERKLAEVQRSLRRALAGNSLSLASNERGQGFDPYNNGGNRDVWRRQRRA